MTDAIDAIFSNYEPSDDLLILLQGGKAFEGRFVALYPGYAVLADISGVREREVYIPRGAIVAVTRPW